MKRLGLVLLLVMVVSLVVGPSAFADKGGNGAPSGTHYNLNIVGVPQAKTADMKDSNRHTIFVPLGSDEQKANCNIELAKGTDFQVLDGNCFPEGGAGRNVNGTDLNAKFQLPSPDANLNDKFDYTVWVRVPPGQQGYAEMTTCYYDSVDQATYCMTGMTIQLSASKTFKDVSKNLLSVCANLATTKGDFDWHVVPLFYGTDPDVYWWQYDNYGLKIAQLRFYPGEPDYTYGLLDPCSGSGATW